MGWRENSSNNGARAMECMSLDGREDDEHSGLSFVEIYKTFAGGIYLRKWGYLMEYKRNENTTQMKAIFLLVRGRMGILLVRG